MEDAEKNSGLDSQLQEDLSSAEETFHATENVVEQDSSAKETFEPYVTLMANSEIDGVSEVDVTSRMNTESNTDMYEKGMSFERVQTNINDAVPALSTVQEFDDFFHTASENNEMTKRSGEQKTRKQDRTLTIYLQVESGMRLEYHQVPRKYYSSEINTLLVKDIGLRHNMFEILYNGAVIKPMVPIDEFADDDDIVRLDLILQEREKDINKFYLGERDFVFKSGLAIKAIGRKVFIGSEPCGTENVLKVNVKNKNGEDINREVEIKWLPKTHHKPYLGGYRNVINEKRYHHAYTQTKCLPKPKPEVPVFSRDTQTYRMKHFGQATVNHMSTQFSRPGFFVSNYRDKLRTPGVYETADEYLARILQQIIIIQKYTRRWLAKRYVDRLRKTRDAYLQWEKEHDEALKSNRQDRVNHDLERRLHPKCRADFDRLFNALEQWKQTKRAQILSQPLTEAERKAALALLLDEETELIAAIGRHQLCASQKGLNTAQVNLLRKAAAPIKWISSVNGRPLEVQTEKTMRAKELLDIYISLSLDCLTQEERLDILLTTKRVVGEYQHKISREIISLVDREAELMMRGVHDEKLKGLRSRILSRFVKFSEMPEVNPEIANYLNVPIGDRNTIAEALMGNVHYCISCDKYLKKSEFPLSARANRLAPCKSCRRQDNRARKRSDLAPYQHILTELRRTEMELVQNANMKAREDAREAVIQRLERGEPPQAENVMKIDGTDSSVLTTNPFPFLVNKEDIQFLIDEVWERRSVLSGWMDITDLVLSRWRLNEPWSPWNTILVTREEAEAHAKLGAFSLEAAYADALLNTVNQRLVMGQNAFRRLRKCGIRMAYEQVLAAQRMKNPENTADWLHERRARLPPLVTHQKLISDNEARHQAIYQPSEIELPAIKGEKKWNEVHSKAQST